MICCQHTTAFSLGNSTAYEEMIWFTEIKHKYFALETICRFMRKTVYGFSTSQVFQAAKARPALDCSMRYYALVSEMERIHEQNYSDYVTWKILTHNVSSRLRSQ